VAIPRSTVLRGQPLDAIVINASEMRRFSEAGEGADPRALAARYAREYAQHVFLTLMEEGIQVCPSGGRAPGTLVAGYPLEHFQWMGARDMATALVAVRPGPGAGAAGQRRLANAFRHLVAGQRGNGRVQWRDVFQFVGLETGNV